MYRPLRELYSCSKPYPHLAPSCLPFPPLALSALSVPTTRALSLIVTSRDVYREDAPSDARQPEKGAIVCRVAPSWLRFGNFEILHSRKDAPAGRVHCTRGDRGTRGQDGGGKGGVEQIR
ncbi:hypothetical protein BC937DRAFT_92490 [Endogone sp. FLAS-F59071]|nr:hypothetical protein BC937DRAFT_92490 [Endogone sp. FLAS-F59071]|eukprot:RUS15415.1 hypothetical protein BC937DRAFT_92490 [Endogone sp. FLAS-F59071]